MASTSAFSAGAVGEWRICSMTSHRGASLAAADALTLHPWVPGAEGGAVQWRLLGTLSNARYATRDEVDGLRRRQEDLDRPKATLIPIRPTQPADHHRRHATARIRG